MRQKLHKFEQFVQSLLPHEVRYLIQVQQFQDPENLRILRLILDHCQPGVPAQPFDTELDKRKYSNLKKWIQTRLSAIDVDLQYEWLVELERKIVTDDIVPEEEQALLDLLRDFEPPFYYFIKLYELARTYRHFLIIRMRYQDHALVRNFLETHAERFEAARETNERLYQATLDITSQYAFNDKETRRWETWLRQLFSNDTLDGHNRHLAVIRLTFLYINYREFDHLKEIYDELDRMYERGENYSRRLLVNYYANRLILHSKFQEWETAINYGFLSLRHRNTEYLQYLNNLSAVLLRENRHKEALELMQEAIPEMRKTKNYHNKTGFVAFYLKCLLENGQPEQAERYAETFLRANKSQILAQRWHIFFTLYLQVLVQQEKYAKVVSITRKFKLMNREKEYRTRPVYLPSIHWYIRVSQYKEGHINLNTLRGHIEADMELIHTNPHKRKLIIELVEELYHHVPEVFAPLRGNAVPV